MVRRGGKKLFEDLEAWSRRKDSFSINDFLKDRKLSMDDFENLANSRKTFLKVWDTAEAQIWENLKHALFAKSLPRSKIAQYIEEKEVFKDRDSEEVMQSLESCKEKVDLFRKALAGDFVSSMKCSLLAGMITQEQYKEAMAIPREG